MIALKRCLAAEASAYLQPVSLHIPSRRLPGCCMMFRACTVHCQCKQPFKDVSKSSSASTALLAVLWPVGVMASPHGNRWRRRNEAVLQWAE